MHAMQACRLVDSILSLRRSFHPAISVRIPSITRRIIWSPRAGLINHMMVLAETSSFTLNQCRSAQIRFGQPVIFILTIDIAQLIVARSRRRATNEPAGAPRRRMERSVRRCLPSRPLLSVPLESSPLEESRGVG